jgi:hypothetical protein
MARVVDYLVNKLEGRFLAHGVMDSLNVVYPQYWLQLNEKVSFSNHLHVIKKTYYHPKKMGNSNLWVPIVLLVATFDIGQYMFKLSMKPNVVGTMAKPSDVNNVFCLWHIPSTSKVSFFTFPKIFQIGRNCHCIGF